MEQIFDTDAASGWLKERGISRKPKTLRKLRCIGGGPRFRRLNGRPFYTAPDLEQWVCSMLSAPATTNAEAEAQS
jgi:hypothetical protein